MQMHFFHLQSLSGDLREGNKSTFTEVFSSGVKRLFGQDATFNLTLASSRV